MKQTDQDSLLKDLLSDERIQQLRLETLNRSRDALRKGRARRQMVHSSVLVLVPLMVLGLICLHFMPARPAANVDSAQSKEHEVRASSAPAVETISDEELFSLFPGQSVALIGKPGEQMFVELNAQSVQ